MNLIKRLQHWWEHRQLAKKELAVLNRYGWECTCPECKRKMHTNNLVESFRATEMHWHYTCKCGFESHWRLDTPCPMYDPSYKEPAVCPVS